MKHMKKKEKVKTPPKISNKLKNLPVNAKLKSSFTRVSCLYGPTHNCCHRYLFYQLPIL